MPDHKTFSKVNLRYIQLTCPVGQARYSFHLPFNYNLQILLARGNGVSTNVEPCTNESTVAVFVLLFFFTREPFNQLRTLIPAKMQTAFVRHLVMVIIKVSG